MRSIRHREIEVLGYVIERVECRDAHGIAASRSYEILCPRTGVPVGNQPSLRAAKRWIVAQELAAFSAAKQREHAATRAA